MKEFKTLDEQISLLKNKGIQITDEAKVKEKLLKGNFYNIINGYKKPFLLSSSPDTYITGVNFDEIYELYLFDRSLKSIVLPAILSVENTMRSLISYYFSEKYGNMNYLIMSNFDTFQDSGASNAAILKRKSHIFELIGDINKVLSHSIGQKDYVTHYVSKYSFVPLWVLVNALTLGQLSKFYSVMKQPEKIKIAQHWGSLSFSELEGYLKNLSTFRNLCAHDERIYNARCKLPIPNTIYHSILEVDKDVNGNYIAGKKDFLSLIISLRMLLSADEFNTVCNKIIGRIKSLESKISTIKIDSILASMGLSSNNLHIIK